MPQRPPDDDPAADAGAGPAFTAVAFGAGTAFVVDAGEDVDGNRVEQLVRLLPKVPEARGCVEFLLHDLWGRGAGGRRFPVGMAVPGRENRST